MVVFLLFSLGEGTELEEILPVGLTPGDSPVDSLGNYNDVRDGL